MIRATAAFALVALALPVLLLASGGRLAPAAWWGVALALVALKGRLA